MKGIYRSADRLSSRWAQGISLEETILQPLSSDSENTHTNRFLLFNSNDERIPMCFICLLIVFLKERTRNNC